MQASTYNAFRSTLMQQFASAARNQSRPPLAMMPWMADDVKGKASQERPVTSSSRQQHLATRSPNASWGSSLCSLQSPSNKASKLRSRPSKDRRNVVPPAHFVSMSLSSVAEDESHIQEAEDYAGDNMQQDTRLMIQGQALAMARKFQNLIMTRRTTNHFDNHRCTPLNFWEDALGRAVACGRRAPNHKRTEAFRFKRMLSPSYATERLAEIAYHVSLQKSNSERTAEQKRLKWNQIPAFLVAMVQAPDPLYPDNEEMDEQYKPLGFVPPKTEREMEDYASTCAAIQNILLSLHAEQIVSKWATGPVIQTPAFRQLVGATPCDRVAALVMVGLPKSVGQVEDAREAAANTSTKKAW